MASWLAAVALLGIGATMARGRRAERRYGEETDAAWYALCGEPLVVF